MGEPAPDLAWTFSRRTRVERLFSFLPRQAVWAGLLTFVGYYLGSKIGFALTFHPDPVAVLWPPNSILLAALLLTPPRIWWFVLLAALPGHLIAELGSQVPPGMAFCWFISNSFEALVGATCTRLFIGGPMRFTSLRNVVSFCLFAGLLAPFVSSFMDAGFVQMNHWGGASYWEVWRIRFFSSVLAALTFAPAIVTWFSRDGLPNLAKRRDYFEVGLLYVGLIGVSYLALDRIADPVLFYAPLPFLLWAAVRFGPRETTTAILLVSFLAIWGAAHNSGPFTTGSPGQNARSIQIFLIVMVVPFLFLATVIEERRKGEERFAKAFRSSPGAMSLIRRRDGTLIDVNNQWLKMFGYRRDEVIGRVIFDLNPRLLPGEHIYEIVSSTQGEVIRDLERDVCTKTGEVRRISLSGDTVQLAGELCYIVIIRDITEVKRAEEAIRNLAHASRLAAMGELTASIAHEINQPLGAIMSNAEAAELLLESDSPRLEEIRQILTDIRTEDERASRIIQQIRLLARKREIEWEVVNLNDVVSDVLNLVTSDSRRRNISLQAKLAAEPLFVRGNKVHLQQVFMNLILNGIEAIADSPRTDHSIVVRTEANNQTIVRASVTDTGPGIRVEGVSRLFESFFTTKDSGIGLGLAIARSIVEAHEGRIFAENNGGGGATFWLELPVVQTDQPNLG